MRDNFFCIQERKTYEYTLTVGSACNTTATTTQPHRPFSNNAVDCLLEKMSSSGFWGARQENYSRPRSVHWGDVVACVSAPVWSASTCIWKTRATMEAALSG